MALHRQLPLCLEFAEVWGSGLPTFLKPCSESLIGLHLDSREGMLNSEGGEGGETQVTWSAQFLLPGLSGSC